MLINAKDLLSWHYLQATEHHGRTRGGEAGRVMVDY